MDKLDGVNATKIIRNEIGKDKQQLPVIALTGNELDKDTINICIQLFNSILRKPYTKEEVIEIVNTYQQITD